MIELTFLDKYFACGTFLGAKFRALNSTSNTLKTNNGGRYCGPPPGRHFPKSGCLIQSKNERL
ncbi:Bgt-21008 [Blumeria graminis f. sp. tritici]|uniref:Bgt-21008 n=2 Tax=Blumeria graminis f. sp. tritici TaxID=62690 RepID=A0A381L7E2_BLUGR|nr:Bgt-21008 [Blumeria graminis f. sp. tritici]